MKEKRGSKLWEIYQVDSDNISDVDLDALERHMTDGGDHE